MSGDERLLLEILTELDKTPAPHGRELQAAVRLHAWCRARWPFITWEVQQYGTFGANLIGRFGCAPKSVLLYSHLDTSLDGSVDDAPVTGRSDPVGPLRVSADGVVSGFGVGVARGPAASALLAFVAAACGAGTAGSAGAGEGDSDGSAGGPGRSAGEEAGALPGGVGVAATPVRGHPVFSGATLLLAGSGTHRLLPGEITGVEAYLADNPRPRRAIIAKAGPPGVLHSEPGAAYLTVRVCGRQGAVLARRYHQPEGGVLAQAGAILTSIEAWRLDHLRSRPNQGQLGAEVGIGHLTSGLPSKPDLIPAVLEIGLYLVTLPGDDVAEVANQLRRALGHHTPPNCSIEVEHHEVHAAGVTDPGAQTVTRALSVWEKHLGPGQDIAGWTGSTDGVVFRGHGIDTVRLGPSISPSPQDPRRDEVALETLATWSRIYQELLD